MNLSVFLLIVVDNDLSLMYHYAIFTKNAKMINYMKMMSTAVVEEQRENSSFSSITECLKKEMTYSFLRQTKQKKISSSPCFAP